MAEEIGVLRVDLSLDSADFVKSTQQVDSKLRALNSEFKASKSGVEGFEKSVEGLRAKQDNLTKTLDLQKTKVNSLKEEYEKVAAAKGKNSVEAEKLLTKYNNSVAAMRKTELQLDKTNRAIKEQEQVWKKAESGIEEYKKKLESASKTVGDFGDKAKDLGGKLSLGLTTPILAAGTAVGIIATQFENSQVKIQNALGLTTQEAEKLANVSENIWAKGFGESLEEVSDALIRVKQNFRDIRNEAELEQITRDSILLAKTFDSDVNEVTRAGNNLMINFGIESKKAYDLMANGAQNGLNFSNEMFDNLAEYSGLFAKMGYSADEYFQLLINGSKEGVYNLDYINDVMKEFQIRVKDGSKATDDAMASMSKSTQDVWKQFLKGDKTVKDVANSVLKELESMDDQVNANQIGVTLFGTKWEDLESDAMYSLKTVNKELSNVNGTLDKMAKAQEQTFNQRWQSLLRDAQQKLEPIGHTILDIAEDWLPKLSNGLNRAVKWFDDLGEEGQGFILTLAGIAASAGPVIGASGLIASGASNVMKLGSSLMDAASKGGGLGAVMTTISGPAGWAILGAAAITGLGVAIYNMNKEVEISTQELMKLQEENFNNALSTLENAKATNELALEYENLREKSMLSNAQMLDFVDIQKELDSTTSDEKIARLKERQDALQKASGLTNEEIARMIQLDGDLQTNAPGVELAFDNKGNAVIKYKDSIVEATNAQLDLAKAELETNMLDNLFAAEESYDKIAEALRKQKEAHQESLKFQDEYNLALQEQQAFENDYYALLDQINKMKADTNNYSKEEILLLEDQLAEMLGQGTQLRENADWLKEQQETHYGIYEEQTKEIANLNKQLKLTESQYNQYMDILAAEVDIVGVQGKQLQQMQDKYNENAKEISQLETKLITEGKLSEKEQERLNKLKEQQTQIENNIGKAEELNAILGEDITKRLIIDDGGAASRIHRDLSESATKYVNVIENRSPVMTRYQGDKSFVGGTALVGELGMERAILPSGRRINLGVNGMELATLPKGTHILNHLETAKQDGLLPSYASTRVSKDFNLENKLKSLFNTRWFAEGGIMTSPTIFGQYGNTILAGGEAGKEAILPLNANTLGQIGKAIAETMNMNGNDDRDITINITTELDGATLAKKTVTYTARELHSLEQRTRRK